MLTHTGRTYEPAAVHPRRCERAGCEAHATWVAEARAANETITRLCAHHASQETA